MRGTKAWRRVGGSSRLLAFDLPLMLASLRSAGDYEVSIRFNDEHVPDSPFVVPVASPSDDARRLTVASLQVRL